MKILPFMR